MKCTKKLQTYRFIIIINDYCAFAIKVILSAIYDLFVILFLFFILFLFQALNGFLMMATQTGKLLYISDNAAEYLGHSMVNLLQTFIKSL